VSRPDPPPRPAFATTHWSRIEVLRGSDPEAARRVLEELCARSWYPLYAYARRRGLGVEEARDATQAFFAGFLARGGFARATPERGRLRAFLLGSFRNDLSHAAEAAAARKRGGGAAGLSLDADEAEGRYGFEPVDALSPERLYEAAWARTLLAGVVESLRAEYEARGKGALFAALESELGGATRPTAELAARLGTTSGAVQVAASRLRARYRELLRGAVLATVSAPEEVEDELRALRAAVATPAPPADAGEDP